MAKSSKPKTKKEELIQMLTRKPGADVAMISDKLGWQMHTTRAAQGAPGNVLLDRMCQSSHVRI